MATLRARLMEQAPEQMGDASHDALPQVPAQPLPQAREFVDEIGAVVVPPFFLVRWARSVLTPQQLEAIRRRENQTRVPGEVKRHG